MSGPSVRIHMDDKELSSPITVSTLEQSDVYDKQSKHLDAVTVGREDSMFSNDTGSDGVTSPYGEHDEQSMHADDLQRAIQVILQNAGRLGIDSRGGSHNGRSRGESYDQYGDYASTAEPSRMDSYVDGRDRNDSLDSVGDRPTQSHYGSKHATPNRGTTGQRRSRQNSQSAISSMRQIDVSQMAGVGSILDVSKLKQAQQKYVSDMEAEEQRKTELQLTDEELIALEAERKEAAKRVRTPLRWNNRVTGVLNIILVLLIVEEVVRNCIQQGLDNGNWIVCALFVLIPFSVFFVIFGINVLLISVNNIAGPISHIKHNSPYYSVFPPLRKDRAPGDKLPLVTVQIPVYKESFREVLKPTLESVMIACRTYESQGGRANIFVNDDGMFLLESEQQVERMMYYFQNNLAWVARPAENRRGKFKKASNMNFCLSVAQRLQEKLTTAIKSGENPHVDEATMKQQLLAQMAEQEHFLAGGPVLMGSYIILLDCDSRIPHDCMLDVVTELDQSPEVSFTQHATQPMQVIHNYWENCIAHFTKRVYNTAIATACSGGDIAPLVGHNAFLRWSALEQVSFIDPFDNKRKYWSEEHVSEDFDLAVRFYHGGYTGRYVIYQDGWTEGVSLCVRDEITRFQKYAYGAAEVMFNPIPLWWSKGVFGDVCTRLLTAPTLGWTSKLNVIAYIGTYFAMALSPLFVMVNFFAYSYSETWREDTNSGTQWMTLTLVFGIIAPLGSVMQGYRTGQHGLLKTLMIEYMYSAQLTVFFTGVGLHLTGAVGRRLLNMDMQFGATAKEVVLTNFFTELKITLKAYKYVYLWCIFAIAVIIVFYADVGLLPDSLSAWKVQQLWSVWPLGMVVAAHIVSPLLLNPVLMKFSF